MSHRDDGIRLAIIDNSVFPEIYKPVEHWSHYLSVPWEPFVAREHRFPDPARFTHLILTGSEASILEPDDWVAEEAEVVAEAARRGLAVLGSCWDHQLLASSGLCAVQAMRLIGRPIWGLQCHPEVDVPTGRKFLRDLVGTGFKGREALLEALASKPRDSGLIQRIVPAFLAALPARP